MTSPLTPPDRSGKITFIGGGNMARSLIGGLIGRGTAPADIRVVAPSLGTRDALERDFGVATFQSAADAVQGADVWMFAVKPQVMPQVCRELAGAARAARPLAVSVAAGITTAQMERWLGGDAAVVRAMPNTPSMLGAGVTGLYANERVDDAGRQRADAVLATAGATVWIDDEALMDSVTAAAGSAPAYIFLMAEAMEDAAVAQGLPADAARTLVLQTILGAARMLTETGEPPAELRRRVTSPGGTTHAAITAFEEGGLRELVARAMARATERGRELSAAHDDDGDAAGR
ncbi:pyrroline-5-carboxylate reductase [Luteimonas sp. JM171]|uniref:pyrroline-5-carboxylate reductase n=1 Tax=Luteimonas sp. JM171 TaxID=1896164 RepID=UPI0008555E59|nr:pyrroline-5-carboxylate reductase [Luteimonas sp. JM171]AOH36272.1 pyrroline-5-carboxylate reductase [Luteimonas sp. JM171]